MHFWPLSPVRPLVGTPYPHPVEKGEQLKSLSTAWGGIEGGANSQEKPGAKHDSSASQALGTCIDESEIANGG